MKKLFTLSVLFTLLFISSKAQFIYWGGGQSFENQNGGNINSVSTSAPSTPTTDTADFGQLWTLFEVYRSSSSSAPACGGAFGSAHIRFNKETDGSTPWLATPDLGFGVNTVSFVSAGTSVGKMFWLQYTTAQLADDDAAGIAAANWVTFAQHKVQTTCADSVWNLNNANARRIRFIVDTPTLAAGYQDDIDSILITSTSAITPVSFGSINVIPSNGLVKLTWNIQTEINTKQYSIERSTDGLNFSSIGTLTANHSSNYVWVDGSPVGGTGFYRVKAIDVNGSYVYSSVVRATSSTSTPEVVIAPNPVQGGQLKLQLNNLTKGNYAINIYNSASQKVYSGTVLHEGGSTSKTLILPTSITRGIYNVHVLNGSTSFNKSIVVE